MVYGDQTVVDSAPDLSQSSTHKLTDLKSTSSHNDKANDNFNGKIVQQTTGSAKANGQSEPKKTWRQAAKDVHLEARKDGYPEIHAFERSVSPTLRTLRAGYKCRLCPHCSRPMIESVLPQHIRECEALKAKSANLTSEAAQNQATIKTEKLEKTEKVDKAETRKRKRDEDKNKKSASINEDAKDPAGDADTKDKGKKKAKKQTKPAKIKQPKQPKPAKEKPSQVYNPDKNCGVPLPNGQPCMRSLTCKQHPMGAKRSVIGRSMPYDVLSSNYHRQHQMKQAQQTANAANAAQAEWDELQESQTQENPEREAQQVLEGVARVYCAPSAKGEVNRSAFRARNFRLREMLSASLSPKKSPPTGELMYGRSLAFRPEYPDNYSYVRSQAVQQAVLVSQIQQRQQQQLRRQQQLMQGKDSQMIQNHARAAQQSIQKPASRAGTPGTPVSTAQPSPQSMQPHNWGASSPNNPLNPQSKETHPEAQSVRLMAQQRMKAVKDQ